MEVILVFERGVKTGCRHEFDSLHETRDQKHIAKKDLAIIAGKGRTLPRRRQQTGLPRAHTKTRQAGCTLDLASLFQHPKGLHARGKSTVGSYDSDPAFETDKLREWIHFSSLLCLCRNTESAQRSLVA